MRPCLLLFGVAAAVVSSASSGSICEPCMVVRCSLPDWVPDDQSTCTWAQGPSDECGCAVEACGIWSCREAGAIGTGSCNECSDSDCDTVCEDGYGCATMAFWGALGGTTTNRLCCPSNVATIVCPVGSIQGIENGCWTSVCVADPEASSSSTPAPLPIAQYVPCDGKSAGESCTICDPWAGPMVGPDGSEMEAAPCTNPLGPYLCDLAGSCLPDCHSPIGWDETKWSWCCSILVGTADGLSQEMCRKSTNHVVDPVLGSPPCSFAHNCTECTASSCVWADGECSASCSSAAESDVDCKTNLDQCDCDQGKIQLGTLGSKCAKFYHCEKAGLSNEGFVITTPNGMGQTCACTKKNCIRCKRTPSGDECLQCTGKRFLHEGECIKTCPAHMASVGWKRKGRQCSNPFVCSRNQVIDSSGIGGVTAERCKCPNAKFTGRGDCHTCVYAAGENGQRCKICRRGYLHDDKCHSSCDEVGLIHYNNRGLQKGSQGRECRQPFTCTRGADINGRPCKCPIGLGRGCKVCDFTSDDEVVCTRCSTFSQLNDQGVCIRKNQA